MLTRLNPELPVCIDVDDGVKGSYRDVLGATLRSAALEPFVSIDCDFAEQNRGPVIGKEL